MYFKAQEIFHILYIIVFIIQYIVILLFYLTFIIPGCILIFIKILMKDIKLLKKGEIKEINQDK